MIPSSVVFDQSTLTRMCEHDPIVLDYQAFFALLEWPLVEQWQAQRSRRGRPPHPESAYLKAFLIRIREGFSSTSQLRRFLVKHPLLVIDLGFHVELDPSAPYGFDIQRTLPCDSWLREKLRTLDQDLLQALLQATAHALQAEIPGVGEVIAFDVKHIYAWVRENNPRESMRDRYCKDRQPTGDPDCSVGVKRSTNQVQPDGSTKEKKEYLWGSGSGVAASTDPVYGDVVLAEYTLPFNEGDVTYFRPLYQRAVVALDQFPTHVTADAAYDFWYVYETVAHRQGIAAIPFNTHGHEEVPKDPNWEKGGLMRVLLDRDGPLYHAVYAQRTACERINSQAQALGIERPKVRNGHSVQNLNTLTYVIINVRALQKAKSINKGLLQLN